MGFDITPAPLKGIEFKYFVEDIVDEPHLVDTRLSAINDQEEERALLFTK